MGLVSNSLSLIVYTKIVIQTSEFQLTMDKFIDYVSTVIEKGFSKWSLYK